MASGVIPREATGPAPAWHARHTRGPHSSGARDRHRHPCEATSRGERAEPVAPATPGAGERTERSWPALVPALAAAGRTRAARPPSHHRQGATADRLRARPAPPRLPRGGHALGGGGRGPAGRHARAARRGACLSPAPWDHCVRRARAEHRTGLRCADVGALPPSGHHRRRRGPDGRRSRRPRTRRRTDRPRRVGRHVADRPIRGAAGRGRAPGSGSRGPMAGTRSHLAAADPRVDAGAPRGRAGPLLRPGRPRDRPAGRARGDRRVRRSGLRGAPCAPRRRPAVRRAGRDPPERRAALRRRDLLHTFGGARRRAGHRRAARRRRAPSGRGDAGVVAGRPRRTNRSPPPKCARVAGPPPGRTCRTAVPPPGARRAVAGRDEPGRGTHRAR